ncbi:hypothetical protein FOA52_008387 [Chlamydomonas sp. UWO 241]|nr:hypothetical protein FOA52_008387 [Chlamydomonas sp. UWO 241]
MERLRGCGGRVGTTVTSRVSVSGSIVGTQHVRGPLPMRQQPPRGLASGQSGHTDRLCHLAVRCAAVGSRASSGGGSGGSSSSSGGSGGSGSASNSAIGSSGPGSQRGELLGWASRASRDLSLVKSPLPFFAPTLGKPPDTLGFLGSIDENDASAADMNPSMGWRTLPHHLGKAELWARMCDEARADKCIVLLKDNLIEMYLGEKAFTGFSFAELEELLVAGEHSMLEWEERADGERVLCLKASKDVGEETYELVSIPPATGQRGRPSRRDMPITKEQLDVVMGRLKGQAAAVVKSLLSEAEETMRAEFKSRRDLIDTHLGQPKMVAGFDVPRLIDVTELRREAEHYMQWVRRRSMHLKGLIDVERVAAEEEKRAGKRSCNEEGQGAAAAAEGEGERAVGYMGVGYITRLWREMTSHEGFSCPTFERLAEMAIVMVPVSAAEPSHASILHSTILSHASFESSLSALLSNKLGSDKIGAVALFSLFQQVHVVSNKLGSDKIGAFELFSLFQQVYREEPDIVAAAIADLLSVKDRDPACERYSQALLYFKGYQAVQCHRVSHWLWLRGRRVLALALQCQMTEVFHVDIHPAAVLGRGMLLDHATGVVIGETAVVGDNVSMLHKVTLGGSGTARTGVRHPTVGHGVLLGAGVIVLGPVMVGAGSKVGAGSVVVSDLPAHSVAVGIPAKVIRRNASSEPVQDMDQVGGYIFDFVI